MTAAGFASRIARRSGASTPERYGRPVGWALLSSAVEKIGFPTVLLVMVLLRNWEGLLITVGAETLLTVAALAFVMKRQRLEYVVKGIAVTPIRYVLVAFELVTIARFASDVWLTKESKVAEMTGRDSCRAGVRVLGGEGLRAVRCPCDGSRCRGSRRMGAGARRVQERPRT